MLVLIMKNILLNIYRRSKPLENYLRACYLHFRDWSAFYTWAIQAIADGTWSGKNYYGGLKEGMVSITDLASFNDPGAAAKIKAATDKMVSGSWDVFQDVIPTNVAGKTVGTAGQPLDDDVIQFKIDWYYKNVKAMN